MNAGAWSKDGEIYFSGSGDSGKVSETAKNAEGEISVKVRSIDSLENLKPVTFIKADIEGAEMEMLQGARETILKYKPKLAICIYHSNEDMVQIPEWIHNLVPEYKLYVRHCNYFPYFTETVLYAQV